MEWQGHSHLDALDSHQGIWGNSPQGLCPSANPVQIETDSEKSCMFSRKLKAFLSSQPAATHAFFFTYIAQDVDVEAEMVSLTYFHEENATE